MSDLKTNQRGFSLVGTLVGVSILSVVMMLSAYLMVDTKKIEVKSGLQADLDRAHILSIQKTRSVNYIKRVLDLNKKADDNLSRQVNTALRNCFSQRGSNCKSYTSGGPNGQWSTLEAASTNDKCTGVDCSIQSDVKYRINCASATGCDSLEIEVSSTYSAADPDKAKLKLRKNRIKIPGILFGEKTAMNFGCADGSNVSSVDFLASRAGCFPERAVSCGAIKRPLQQMNLESPDNEENCPPPGEVNCAEGIRQIGLYASNAVCAD